MSEKRRIRDVVDELHKVEADLEERGQGWIATKVSYCAGALVNLLAHLAPSDQERERCGGSGRLAPDNDLGWEYSTPCLGCPDCQEAP